jgi:hypothetical protein
MYVRNQRLTETYVILDVLPIFRLILSCDFFRKHFSPSFLVQEIADFNGEWINEFNEPLNDYLITLCCEVATEVNYPIENNWSEIDYILNTAINEYAYLYMRYIHQLILPNGNSDIVYFRYVFFSYINKHTLILIDSHKKRTDDY